MNRLQNQQDLLSADARTGRVERVFRDRSETWVDVVDTVRWVDQGRKFLWLSERDGWRHIYLAAKDGTSTTLATKFDADVVQLLGTDTGDEWVYFIASPDDPTSRYLYRARTNGQGTPERVTPADQPGTHSYRLAPGGRMAFHTWSQFDVPPVIDVVELPSHRALRPLTDTTALRKTLASVITRPVEFFTVEVGDGISLDGWMLKPSRLRSGQALPVHHLRLRRAGRRHRHQPVAGRHDALPSRPGRSRVRHRQHGQPRHAGAQGRAVAQGGLRQRRRPVVEGTGGGGEGAGGAPPVPRRLARRGLGLERRRLEHPQRDVPLP